MANFYGDDTNQTVIGGFDRYYGGDGNDALGGDGNSADELYGGFGNDFLIGDGINAFGGGAGTLVDPHFFGPTVNNTGGNNILEGGSGDDALYGLAGDDALYGGAGNESGTMLGGMGKRLQHRGPVRRRLATDYLDGGQGNDDLFGGSGNDTAYGGDGNDLIDFTGQTVSQAAAYGGSGNDTIRATGSISTDLLVAYGGDGNDTVKERTTLLAMADKVMTMDTSGGAGAVI